MQNHSVSERFNKSSIASPLFSSRNLLRNVGTSVKEEFHILICMPAKAGRWELARFFTSLVSVMFFTKRKRGDGGKQWTGYTDLFQGGIFPLFLQICAIFILPLQYLNKLFPHLIFLPLAVWLIISAPF